MHEIHLAPQKLFEIAGFAVSNSIFTTWLGLLVVMVLAYLISKAYKRIPGYAQSVAEIIIESLLNLITEVTGDKRQAEKLLPFLATFFIFILSLNWMGLVPGVGSILYDHTAILRPSNTDINTTLALALISVIGTHMIGIGTIGFFKHISHYLNFKSPIDFFVGILHLVGEIAKTLSFSFRLFGNIFAGEVLLIVITFLIPYIAPIPFYGLELFVGFIQALVFTMLTLVFITMATAHSDHEEHAAH